MAGQDDYGNTTNLSSLLNSPSPNGKNLLDNVSLMTTTTPMISQNNSLQRSGNTMHNSEDGGNFLDEIRGRIGTDKITEENEKSNISTLTAFEKQLNEHLNGGNVTATSTPAASMDWKHTEIGTSEIMYGFDLSPAHSIEKKTPQKLEKKSETDQIDQIFKQSKIDQSGAAPNFMQARVASPRLLRSEKGAMSEDTETMMSQVFSSQDQTVSMKGKLTNSTRKSTVENEESLKQTGKHKKVREKSPKKINSTWQKKTQSSVDLRNNTVYSSHSRLEVTDVKAGGLKSSKISKKTPGKTTKTKQGNIITPKSPKSRQSTMKVASKIRSGSPIRLGKSKSSMKTSPSKKSNSNLSLHSNVEPPSELNYSLKSADFTNQETENEGPSTMLHMVKEIDLMKAELEKVQDRLVLVTNEKKMIEEQNHMIAEENEQVKKENFVLKSKVAHLTNKYRNDIKSDSSQLDNNNEQENRTEVEKLKQEMAAQERLLQGFQQENEKIYSELKNAKKENQDNEHAMYKENLKLKAEVAHLKETAEQNHRIIVDVKGSTEKPMALSDYDSVSSTNQSALQRKIKLIETELKMEEGLRRKAEAALKKVTDERDTVEKQLQMEKYKNEEIVEKTNLAHKSEMEALQSKLSDAQKALHNARVKPKIPQPVYQSKSASELNHFQKRVVKLENDLEKRDMLANQAVQAVQEQYQTVKSKYEERINDLEMQIKSFREHSAKKNKRSIENQALKKDYEMVRKQLAETLNRMREREEESLREKMELEAKIEKMQKNHSAKTPPKYDKEKQDLKQKCELKEAEIARLQALLMKSSHKKPSGEKGGSKALNSKSVYNPNMFEGEGYSSIMKQNKDLKRQLENLSIEMKHNKVINDALVVKMEQEGKKARDSYEREIKVLQLKTSQAESVNHKDLERSDLLKQQVLLLERELDKCQDQVSQMKNEMKNTAILKIREQALQTQVQELLQKLHQTRTQSPSSSARKVAHLEDKIRVLEEQFRIKQETFKRDLINNSNSVMKAEFMKVQQQLAEKNNQLSRFRLELDSILLVLNELQSQGVKIPLPNNLLSIF